MAWEQGFISPEMGAITAECHKRYRAEIDQFLAINRRAVALQSEITIPRGAARPLLAAVLFIRVLSHSQGVYLMAVRGMETQCRVLLRTLMEAIFYLFACIKNDNFADKFLDGFQTHRRKMFNKMKQLGAHDKDVAPEAVNAATPELLAEIDAAIAEVKASEISAYDAADKAGLLSWYLSAYAIFSSAVHSGVQDLESHLDVGPDGKGRHLKNVPELDEVGVSLDSASDMVLLTIETMGGFFKVDCAKFVQEQRATLHPRIKGRN